MTEALAETKQPIPGVHVVTLNRPEKRNALNVGLLQALHEAVYAIESDDGARVIVLRGAGPVFCAGLDLREAQDAALAHSSADWVARTLEAVATTRCVTIAAVHGAAVAGGAGLMSACDLVVAEEGTQIGYPEVRRGLAAAVVMTFLRRQLRDRDARELLLLAELVDARRAREMGLVTRVVPKGEAYGAAVELAKIALKGAPGAIANTKQALAAMWPRPIADDFRRALEMHKAMRGSDEAAEGIAAFNEKRPPHWDPSSGS